jgi:hypothetical protein
MIERVGKRKAITRDALHEQLRAWLATVGSDTDMIGAVDSPNQRRTQWIWVRVRDARYCLHADTNAVGVRHYIQLLDLHGEGMAWTVVASERGNFTKVAFGPECEVIPGFYFYLPA